MKKKYRISTMKTYRIKPMKWMAGKQMDYLKYHESECFDCYISTEREASGEWMTWRCDVFNSRPKYFKRLADAKRWCEEAYLEHLMEFLEEV